MKFTKKTVVYRVTWNPNTYDIVLYTGQKTITAWLNTERIERYIDNPELLIGQCWVCIHENNKITDIFIRQQNIPNNWNITSRKKIDLP